MIGSDGLPHDAFAASAAVGDVPARAGPLQPRRSGLFPLETAVHKMTGLTAQTFGLKDRGVLRAGAFADITRVRCRTRVDEAATFEKPIAPAHGIDTVIVNGAVVWRDGRSTGARPGRVLRRSTRQRRLDHWTTAKAQALGTQSATGSEFLCVNFAPSRLCGSSLG